MQFHQPPSPDEIVRRERTRIARLNYSKTPLAHKIHALKVACKVGVSLPVMTIATRDRIEAEMKARRQADLNRAELVGNVTVSPEPLDS